MSVDEPDAGVSDEHIRSAPQGSRSQAVICRQQKAIVTVSPVDQALIEGRDVPLIGRVDGDFDARLASRDLFRYFGAVISRSVLDDEDPHVDAFLVIEDAGDTFLKEVAVIVTRNDDAN
jgi:hypothetical protein